MKFIPGSLLWRTLAVVVAALVLSQAAAVWLLHEFVTQPRMRLGINQFVSHLKTVSAALQTMSEPQQDEFVKRIAEKEGIGITFARNADRMRPAQDVPPVRLFRDHIREVFGPEAEVYVRANEGRPSPVLWVKLPAGSREFWVRFPRGRIERDPGTAFVAWGAVGLAIAILATFFIMWRLTRPLHELATAATRARPRAPGRRPCRAGLPRSPARARAASAAT